MSPRACVGPVLLLDGCQVQCFQASAKACRPRYSSSHDDSLKSPAQEFDSNRDVHEEILSCCRMPIGTCICEAADVQCPGKRRKCMQLSK